VFKAHNISKPEEFVKMCLKAGFNVAGIKTLKDLKTMAAVAML